MNNLANHLELEPTASWTSLGMPGPPKCQELRRKDGVSKRFPGPAKSDQWISEKNTIQNWFFPSLHQTPSGQGFLLASRLLKNKVTSPPSDRELNEGRGQVSIIRPSFSMPTSETL